MEARQGGGSEAGEGGSEADRTKEERKEGGSEAGRRKEARVHPSNQARHSSSSLTSKRCKSGRRYEGHLYMVTKCTNEHYIYDQTDTWVAHRLPDP